MDPDAVKYPDLLFISERVVCVICVVDSCTFGQNEFLCLRRKG